MIPQNDYYPVWPQSYDWLNNPSNVNTNSATGYKYAANLKPAGYLNNGIKSGNYHSDELVQFNLCSNHYLKIKTCFTQSAAPYAGRTLAKASVRFFDIDHGKDKIRDGESHPLGPEVLQFSCPGGTFSLYGHEVDKPDPDLEFLVHIDDYTKTLEHTNEPIILSPNGLKKHTYDCPELSAPNGGLVTLWSARYGTGSDNPTDPQSLNKIQEQSMVIINHVNVDCFDVTLANLPAVFEAGTTQAIADPTQIAKLEASQPIDGSAGWNLDSGACPWKASGRNWLLAGLTGETPNVCPPPPPSRIMAPPSSPSPIISVHGDPIFKHDGQGKHFWVKEGSLQPLLSWKVRGQGTFDLMGKTFSGQDRDKENQWFEQFVIRQNGATVLDASAKATEHGTMQIHMDGENVGHVSQPAGKVAMYASAKHAVKVQASARPDRLDIGDKHSEVLSVDAGGLKLSIFSSAAAKFSNKQKQQKYMHLNIDFDNGLPDGAVGVFAELASARPMSHATRMLLKKPHGKHAAAASALQALQAS